MAFDSKSSRFSRSTATLRSTLLSMNHTAAAFIPTVIPYSDPPMPTTNFSTFSVPLYSSANSERKTYCFPIQDKEFSHFVFRVLRSPPEVRPPSDPRFGVESDSSRVPRKNGEGEGERRRETGAPPRLEEKAEAAVADRMRRTIVAIVWM